jgi:hypothetical protein
MAVGLGRSVPDLSPAHFMGELRDSKRAALACLYLLLFGLRRIHVAPVLP